MMTVLIIIHVIACIVLIALVLIQRGRGAGLVESFAGVESMFGTKTSTFLTRTTTIMSIVFFITCLGLAVLSVRQSKSLMRDAGNEKAKAVSAVDSKTVQPEAPKPDAAVAKETPKASAAATLPTETAKPDAAKVQ
jgi:preprotein translocase subunit SecG